MLLNNFVQFHLEKEPVFVVVVSTTGDGDAPDTANKFWRRLKKRTLAPDHLSNCKYALLGECLYVHMRVQEAFLPQPTTNLWKPSQCPVRHTHIPILSMYMYM